MDFLKLFVSIMVCQLAGAIGAFFTAPSITSWYMEINKPAFTPPNWLFGPVWLVLYLLMGVSLYLVWTNGGKELKAALVIFAVHLVFNNMWSIIFFGMKQPLWAFVEILVLLFFIILTMVKFFSISKTAGYLLIPYLLWVSFASVLNFYIFRLN